MSLCASFLVFHCIVVMVFVIFLGHLDVVVFHFLSLRLFSCHYLRNLFGTGKCRICTSCKIKMIDVFSSVIVFVIFLGQENVVFLLVEILEMINIVFLYLSLILYSCHGLRNRLGRGKCCFHKVVCIILFSLPTAQVQNYMVRTSLSLIILAMVQVSIIIVILVIFIIIMVISIISIMVIIVTVTIMVTVHVMVQNPTKKKGTEGSMEATRCYQVPHSLFFKENIKVGRWRIQRRI